MRAGPGGWAEGCGGLGALPPPATPDPAALAERGLPLPPHPVRCSGPRDPGGVGLRGPPPPDPRGPGASEPPAGLGAANLERPTCPAPARCPNPPGATEARSTGAPQPRPFALPRRPPCPHAARQAPDLPERADEPQAGTQTDTHTRTHPRHGRQLACASSSARAIAPGRGRGQTKGPADGCRERQRQKSMKLPRQTPRRQEGDTHTHTHTRVWSLEILLFVVAGLSPTFIGPMECGPSGSSVRGISQARILEWVAISFSRGSSRPRDQTRVSCGRMPCHLNQHIANSLGKIQRKELVCY